MMRVRCWATKAGPLGSLRFAGMSGTRLSSSSKRLASLNGIMGVANHTDQNLAHLTRPDSTIDAYWIEQLRRIERPVVRALIPQLIPDNPLGFDASAGSSTVSRGPARAGTLLDYTIQQKKKHPQKIILIRSGEFYETYGIDALMLIAYAGLNPMGNKCKAGCPVKNVQSTLDSLTSVGLSIAVFEEIAEVEKNVNKIKSRALTQIVSPASSTYIYDLCLRSDDIEYRENRPAVGIMKTTNGYTLCQVFLDEHCVTIHERLTQEGVRSIVSTSGAIDPIFVQDASDLGFLSNHHAVEKLSGYSEQTFPSQLLARISHQLEVDTSSFYVFNQLGYHPNRRPRPIYTSTALQIGLIPNDNVPNLLPHLLPKSHGYSTQTIHRFLRKYILNPPPYAIAKEMSQLCQALAASTISIPPLTPLPHGKVVSLLSAKQGNVHLFRDLLGNAQSVIHLIDRVEDYGEDMLNALLALVTFESGLPVTKERLKEGCIRVSNAIHKVIALQEDERIDTPFQDSLGRIPDEFFKRNEEEFRGKISLANPEIKDLYEEIRMITDRLVDAIRKEYPVDGEILHDMMENAIMLREKPLAPSSSSASSSLSTISTQASLEEEEASAGGDDNSNSDGRVPKGRKLKSKERPIGIEGVDYIPYLDRKGKVVSKRYTTQNVSQAMDDYLSITAVAPYKVSRILQNLSESLGEDLVTIIQSSHLAIILQTALAHTISSIQKGWVLPEIIDIPVKNPQQATSPSTSTGTSSESSVFSSSSSSVSSVGPSTAGEKPVAMTLRNLIPYWMSHSTSTSNDIDLEGIFLLTAPNMSGKSTLMRSILVAALLGNCGLFIPASYGKIPRFDTFFLRTASYDVPSESKSAFALEMDDMRVVLRDATYQSLVMIDELGKGTSARDGSALAGALLEYLDQHAVTGVFATHLHEIFHLPLQLKSVKEKRMGFVVEDVEVQEVEKNNIRHAKDYGSSNESGVRVRWTYQLEDGRCEDSMALTTARQYHIDRSVIYRAEELLRAFDSYCRPPQAQPELIEQQEEPMENVDTSHVNTDVAKEGLKKGNEEANRDMETISTGKIYNLQSEVAPVVESVFAEVLGDDRKGLVGKGIYIPVNHLVPALLEGSSILYVLHLSSTRSRDGSEVGLLYVGETESLTQRLHQHRVQYRKKGIQVEAMAWRVTDKSTARQIETLCLRKLKAQGFTLDRDSDSRHKLFGGMQL